MLPRAGTRPQQVQQARGRRPISCGSGQQQEGVHPKRGPTEEPGGDIDDIDDKGTNHQLLWTGSM